MPVPLMSGSNPPRRGTCVARVASQPDNHTPTGRVSVSETPHSTPASQGHACVSCGLPGVLRPAPAGGSQLVVCGVCWQLADGDLTELGSGNGSAPVTLADADPTAAARAEAHVWHDEAGAVEGTLLSAGVRHALLRWIPRSMQLALWQEISNYVRPTSTRACWEGSAVWMAEVVLRVSMQDWYDCRKKTAIECAETLAASCLQGHRPLTRIVQEEIAREIGRTDRTVRTVLRWLQDEGLLGRVLRGTRTRRLAIPHGETDAEREARLAREADEQALRRRRREAARAHARAEIEALHAGRTPPVPDPFAAGGNEDVSETEPGDGLLRIGSVYELLIPTEPEPAPLHRPGGPSPEVSKIDGQGAAQGQESVSMSVKPNQHGELTPAACAPKQAVTWSNTINFRPNGFSKVLIDSPRAAGAVENPQNRGATRRLRQENAQVRGCFEGRNQSLAHRSRAERAAGRLLGQAENAQAAVGGRLPWRLAEGVSRTWLAAQIRPLVNANWTDADIVQQITTRGGRYPHLPLRIPNPRGWIRAALSSAVPEIRPVVRQAADNVEAETAEDAQRRQQRISQRDQQADRDGARGRAAAIRDCSLCDEFGWVALDGAGPEVRCDHQAAQQTPLPQQNQPAPKSGRAAARDRLDQDRAARRRALQQQMLDEARTATAADTGAPTDETPWRARQRARGLIRSADVASDQTHRRALDRARADRGRR